MIEIGRDICRNYLEATSREWLETNGIGGYASGTISGTNTRRYHGLLVAATEPPLGRFVLVSKFEETLIVDGERFDLSSNQYTGAVHPHGYQFLTRFRLDPFPVWTYTIGTVEIERTIFMVHGENTTVIQWGLKKPPANAESLCLLEVKPLVAFRDHHHLRGSDLGWNIEFDETGVMIGTDGTTTRLHLAHNAESIDQIAHWYRNFEYEIEKERGFDHREDLFQPLGLTFDLARNAEVIASTEPRRNPGEGGRLRAREIKRRTQLIISSGVKDTDHWPLILAADQFIVNRAEGKTIIAGYHWFSDWGRDTMTAIKGLTLSTGRPEIARSILVEFASHISEGMLPNRFPDSGASADYNTVDATLWYFEAIRDYVELTGDLETVREYLYDKLVDMINWHVSGTRFNIHLDTDGLIFAGRPGVQLTWMDAKIGDWVVTPRTGKPVEIQALWYNALRIMAELAVSLGDEKSASNYDELAAKAKTSFNERFWNAGEECLYDVIDGTERDGSVRPNQIFAVGLHYPILDDERAKLVVDKVERDLLTPFGLRSLSPSDPEYVPYYVGDAYERDSAYHQGTVWAWLIGPFIDAYRRVHPVAPETEENIRGFTEALVSHLSEAMLGQISEIFDAEPPFHPRGCAAQAWSVGELLRTLSVQSGSVT